MTNQNSATPKNLKKIDKPAHRQYKDLKRTKTLLEILINKSTCSLFQNIKQNLVCKKRKLIKLF